MPEYESELKRLWFVFAASTSVCKVSTVFNGFLEKQEFLNNHFEMM